MSKKSSAFEGARTPPAATHPESAVRAACAALRQSYSALPTGGSLHTPTHPDSLASMARLFGLKPAAVNECRVLELGCARGGNLIPMALGLPGASFLGIDIADTQVATARTTVERLGLTNIEFQAASIYDLDEDFAPFDYIICDGVFSWVPPDVQEKILRICTNCLAPQGVAYISFNAYPGWHVRGIVRDMLRIHTRQLSETLTKITAARQLLERLNGAASDKNSSLALIQAEVQGLRSSDDAYLFHEHLVEHNHPFYFADFIERASSHGLQYLADIPTLELDSDSSLTEMAGLGVDLRDRVQVRQYRDFFENSAYHCSLLCHASVPLLDLPTSDAVRSLLVASSFRPQSADPQMSTANAEEFVSEEEAKMTTGHPLVKAALACLSRHWPRAIPFPDLWSSVSALLQTGPEPFPVDADADRELLAQALVHCYLHAVVEFRTRQPDLTVQVAEKPLASPLARLQAGSNMPVSNLLHRDVKLEPLDQRIVQWLDGTRDRSALLEQLEAWMSQERVTGEAAGSPTQHDSTARKLDQSLARLAARALLMS